MVKFTLHVERNKKVCVQHESEDWSADKSVEDVSSLAALTEAVFALKPSDKSGSIDGYTSYFVFNGSVVKWVDTENDTWKLREVDSIDDLVLAVLNDLK